jgi:hypothetical protein
MVGSHVNGDDPSSAGGQRCLGAYPAQVTDAKPSEAKPSRGRNVLVGTLGVLACIVITLSASALWVHQVALNTDRYVTVITRTATNPEVVDEISGRLATQIVAQFDIPQLVKPLIQNWIQDQIGAFMDTDVFSDAWGAANRVAHTAVVSLLRGDSRLDSSDGELTIGVLPVVIVGLGRLQEVGLIPDDVELPDPSDAEASTVIREVITDRLGIDIPPDFGEVPIVRMSRLETARQLVTIFDVITVASLVLAAVLAAATIWLARNRRRAVIRLGFGTAAAVVVVQLLALVLSQVVANSMARETPILAAIVGALISNLALALTVVLVLAIGAALATMVVSRRAQPAG